MEYASKAEAINGADNTKIMTPLRVKQSILANSQGGGGNGSTGDSLDYPIASYDRLGMIKVGDNLWIDDDGRLNAPLYEGGGGSGTGSTNWVDAELTEDFTLYNASSYCRFAKVGNIVHIQGVLKPTKSNNKLNSATETTAFNLPEEYRPSQNLNILCQGSGTNIFNVGVNVSGNINIYRYRNSANYASTPPGTSTWLPFNITYFIDTGQITGGGGNGITNETDPIFKNSPAYNITQNDIDNWNSGGNVDLSNYALKEELPTKTSQLTNDSGFIDEIKTINGQSLVGTGNIDIDVGDCNVVVSPTTPITGEPVWVQYSYNMFDKSTTTGGHFLEDGTSELHSSFKKSAYIPVEPNETYTLQHNSLNLNNVFNCLYDEDKNFVTSIARNPGNNVITMPDNVYYIRVNLYLRGVGSGTDDTEDNTFQMVKGSTALPYMAYNPAKDDRILLKKGDVYDELFAKSKLNYPGGGTLTETDPVFTNSPAYNITQNDINNWNNNIGGITEETDPVFSQSPAFIITQDDIEKWNSFSSGSNASKLIFVEESDGSYTLRKAGQ